MIKTMQTYYYRPIGEIHPVDTQARNEKEARLFFRQWANVKRLNGEVWSKSGR